MAKWGWLAGFLGSTIALLLLLPSGSGQTNDQDLWRHRNIGKALYESPTSIAEAPAELKKALELAPDSFRDRLNYGLALLRVQDTQNAIEELEKAQRQNPRIPHTWFNLGIAYKKMKRNADAIRQFQRMVELVPGEPVSHYNLGLLHNLENRTTEALRHFEAAARLDRDFIAPRFQIYDYYRLSGDDSAADRARVEFQSVKARRQNDDEKEDVEWSLYSELYDPLQARPAATDSAPAASIRFEDHELAGAVDPRTAGLLVLDVDGNGKPDLMAWSRERSRIYRSGTDLIADSGLANLPGILNVAAGDFNNDGLPDLCVLTGNGGARLFRNEHGKFVAAAITVPAEPFHKAVWLDFDHDYDLDLFLLGQKSALLRNQGGGVFADYSKNFPFAAGDAIDAIAFRAVPETKGIDLLVSYAGRKGVLYRDQLLGRFEPEPLESLEARSVGLRAIDIDNDSWTDLAFSASGSVSLVMNRLGKFIVQPTRAKGAYAFADVENRGFCDLIAGNGVSRNQGLAKFGDPVQYPGFSAFPALTESDFDGDGRVDPVAVAPDGRLHLLFNRTVTRNAWLRVGLTGVKNLKTAPGAEVEIKAGEHYQRVSYSGIPLLFGLGARTRVDSVRVTWPNGSIQNQPGDTTGRTLEIKEAPRLSGSCPMVYSWNGSAFQFITDVLGVAPLGASAGGGNSFPVDHDEYVSIPAEALSQAEGRYPIRITEELHEVTYLDQAQLIAVDHPREFEIFTNEKFKSPPFPEFRLFGVRRRIHPVAAQDRRGRNVLDKLVRQDRVYVSSFGHDYGGTAEMHTLSLDFGPGTTSGNSNVLFLHGWVDWADGSTFLNASQRPNGGLVFPFLQVMDDTGKWRTVVEDMGVPSGKPKTIAVDLSGKFLSRSRQIRIVTNLCVDWDEIFLGEGASAPPVRLTPVDAGTAFLRLRGFSKPVIHPRREQPEAFDYARWTADPVWNQIPGMYTRYGEVRELVLAADDRFVIMGSGDELQLNFPATALPPLPDAWRRDFLLLIDGWAKDSDANTAYSQSVEPLPFHRMSHYPYPPSEHYPEDEPHRVYRRTYNTRPAIRFVQPLIARRPP
jgi:tetratricopeptide (TPR) repeat protein